MYISLPLPVDKCEINIVYVPYLPMQRQLAIKIQLEREATVKELKQQVEKNAAASASLSIQENHSASILLCQSKKCVSAHPIAL